MNVSHGYTSIYPSIYLDIHPLYLPSKIDIYMYIYIHTQKGMYVSHVYTSIHPSIYLDIHPSIYLPS